MDLSLSAEELQAFLTVSIVFVLLLIFLATLLRRSCRVVRHSEVMIVERFGKYKTTLKPGLHWLWPVIDSPRHIKWRYLDAVNNSALATVKQVDKDVIDMREHVIDFGHQRVITHDTVSISIDALVYFRVVDPRMAVFKIQNLPDAVELLTQATLRNIIASMTLDDTFSSREQINSELLRKIRPDVERWGVMVTRVEIFNIMPPVDIKQAMEQQVTAERERRSMVLQADGRRKSDIIRSRGNAAKIVFGAEGKRAADLATAKGDAEAMMISADAEAQSVTSIKKAVQAAGVRAVDYLSGIQWLNSLRTLTAGNTGEVVLVPLDTVDGIHEIMNQAS